MISTYIIWNAYEYIIEMQLTTEISCINCTLRPWYVSIQSYVYVLYHACVLILSTTHTPTMSPYIVHLTTVYIPHSSQLNLSTPDSQCQLSRSGVFCGQCQHSLSTVFGSSQCKHCSSIYLLIIIPIGIAGYVMVLLLLSLKLNTTDGKINSFYSIQTLLVSTIQYFIQLADQSCTLSFH